MRHNCWYIDGVTSFTSPRNPPPSTLRVQLSLLRYCFQTTLQLELIYNSHSVKVEGKPVPISRFLVDWLFFNVDEGAW